MTKKYKKIISLEPLKSRVPSILPAYDDDGNVIYFDKESIDERDGMYQSNYGLVPLMVSFDRSPESIGCGSYSLSCSDSTYKISFENLSKIYGFFKKYYHLLKSSKKVNTVYTSAVEYAMCEYDVDDEDSPFLNRYKELDDTFKEYGGCVKKISIECAAGKFLYDIEDDGFYKWITENIIPTFTIPKRFVDEWNRDVLYYPDVPRWIGWFCERSEFSRYAIDECSNSSDCCECEKYNKLGGLEMYNLLRSWYTSIQGNIEKLNSYIMNNEGCFEPSLQVPVSLRGRLDNIGLFFDPIQEYELGKDYRTAGSYETAMNNKDGAIVYKDGVPYQLKDPGKIDGYRFNGGYQFDEIYLELKDDELCWVKYENTEGGRLKMDSEEVRITTRAASRLRELESKDRYSDDIGNQIDGIYLQEPFEDGDKTKYAQPPQGTELEPLYQLGYVANIRYSSDYTYYLRDYIKSMKFYYVNPYDGEVYRKTEVDVTEEKTPLKAIKESTEKLETEYPSSVAEDIKCKIEYVIGEKVYPEDYTGEKVKEMQNGLLYTEVVTFVKTPVEFYLKKPEELKYPNQKLNVSAHSVSYTIYTYNMVQDKIYVTDTTYGEAYEEAVAEVKYDHYVDVYDVDKTPAVMMEYAVNGSVPQKVTGDIYINRGINSSFEKHIKLGEVTTLEALEQYGNGYFKQQK